MLSIGSKPIAAFDFDHTIITVNSDTYINKILIKKEEPEKTITNFKYNFPSEIDEIEEKYGWTERMNAVLKLMHSKFNVTRNELLDCLKEIIIEDSMKQLFYKLKSKNFELLIISDANTIFIETILEQNGILDLFNREYIFTNKAEFDANGCLKVTPFNEIHNQNRDPFDCESGICARNICKGVVLKNFIEKKFQNNFENNLTNETIIYVGDGHNDYCPGLNLKEKDFLFVKKNFSLAKLLQKQKYMEKIKTKIIYWSDAIEIDSEI